MPVPQHRRSSCRVPVPSWVVGVFTPSSSRLFNLIGKPPNQLFSCPQVPLSAPEGQAPEPCCHGVHGCPFCAWQTQARQKKTEPFGTEGSADAAHLFYFVIFVLQTRGPLSTAIGRTGVLRFVGMQTILVHGVSRSHTGKILPCSLRQKLARAFMWVFGATQKVYSPIFLVL